VILGSVAAVGETVGSEYVAAAGERACCPTAAYAQGRILEVCFYGGVLQGSF
jgi:hypothetical protein